MYLYFFNYDKIDCFLKNLYIYYVMLRFNIIFLKSYIKII